jgi:hypothetical protein
VAQSATFKVFGVYFSINKTVKTQKRMVAQSATILFWVFKSRNGGAIS